MLCAALILLSFLNADESNPPVPQRSVAVDDHHDDEGGPTSVFRDFPMDPDLYIPEVAQLVHDGVPEKFGHDEWAAIVLSHEIHQHIGIFTILGAKMGVRAKELLEAPRRAVRVNIETVPETPMACAADGLQASLGSTFGQSLIEMTKADTPRLAATFRYKERTLRLALSPDYQKAVAGIIEDNSKKYGFLSPAYFDGIRATSYHIWGTWDRKAIFTEEWGEGTK